MTNVGGVRAEAGLRVAAGELYRRYLAAGAPPPPTAVERTPIAAEPHRSRPFFSGDTRRGQGK